MPVERAQGYCICGCHRPAATRHHVVYQQHIRRAGGDVGDPRSMVPVADHCHGMHHQRARPFTLTVLPDVAFEFARELLGAGRAYEYLRRYYNGTDARLDALLSEWEASSPSGGGSSRLLSRGAGLPREAA